MTVVSEPESRIISIYVYISSQNLWIRSTLRFLCKMLTSQPAKEAIKHHGRKCELFILWFNRSVAVCPQAGCCLAGDMMRKSIVFNPSTPDVFYCPLFKPKSFDDMLVKSRPLSKLCEFKGRPLPSDYKSDCYGDVDETEFACAEKHRILVSEEQ